jgi:23S rRNA (adenine1618-N6)-methyltransferase
MSVEKASLHPRNKHRSRYDFPELIKSYPELAPYVFNNAYGDLSVDFSNPDSVKALNKALLKHFYAIDHWDIPEGYLCPPIPGRSDYIHYIADLLSADSGGVIPKGGQVKGLDIGTGANCIYPIIGHQEYGWSFTGSEIDQYAVKAAKAICAANPELSADIVLKHQPNKQHIFKGIVNPGELYDFSLCNPPFHASAEEARAGNKRKVQNLNRDKHKIAALNFGGKDAELWYEGGEAAFIRNMIMESKDIGGQCLWFSSLVSKSSNLPFIYHMLEALRPADIRTVEMAQGQKISRFVAWTFTAQDARREWTVKRWAKKQA